MFKPSIIVTTTERSGGNADPTTERATETRYWLEREDNICITHTGLMVERGRYGDPERAILQVNCCFDEWQDAIINCVAAQHTIANDSTASDYARERAEQFLERLNDKLAEQHKQPETPQGWLAAFYELQRGEAWRVLNTEFKAEMQAINDAIRKLAAAVLARVAR